MKVNESTYYKCVIELNSREMFLLKSLMIDADVEQCSSELQDFKEVLRHALPLIHDIPFEKGVKVE